MNLPELETRTCDGGCGRSWRCMPSSARRFALSNCADACKRADDAPKPPPSMGHAWGDSYVTTEATERAVRNNPRRGRPPGSKNKAEDPVMHLVAPTIAAPAPDPAPARETPAPAAIELPGAKLRLGVLGSGKPFEIDLARLLGTRLLVQAGSGGGKTRFLLELIEAAAPHLPIVIIDIEGEYHKSGLPVISAPEWEVGSYVDEILLGGESRIFDISDLNRDDRLQFTGNLLNELMGRPRDQWRPILVIVDEANVFAPNNGGGEEDYPALKPLVDVAARGRKRGFGLVVATQRLTKLHKDIAAECVNKMIGRTTLDIDKKRAAEAIGSDGAMDFAALKPGQFYISGPAFGDVESDDDIVCGIYGEDGNAMAPTIETEEKPKEREKMGRRSFSENLELLEAAAAEIPGAGIKATCEAAGLSESTGYAMMKRAKADTPDRAEALAELMGSARGKTAKAVKVEAEETVSEEATAEESEFSVGDVLANVHAWLTRVAPDQQKRVIQSACILIGIDLAVGQDRHVEIVTRVPPAPAKRKYKRRAKPEPKKRKYTRRA